VVPVSRNPDPVAIMVVSPYRKDPSMPQNRQALQVVVMGLCKAKINTASLKKAMQQCCARLTNK
jgi:hypothetical protein